MKSCSFCGNKNLKKIQAQYIYKHNGKYLLIDNVPCERCEFCGEKYFEAKILKQIEKEFSNIYNGTKKVTKQIIMPIQSFDKMAYI